MSVIGACNCESIHLILAEKPSSSAICHCTNCKKAGGGAFSANYILSEDLVTVEDPTGCLKVYKDGNTKTGNAIDRKFCSNCGSAIITISPSFPGKAIVKASLFGSIAVPARAVFQENQEEWLQVAVDTA